MATRQQLQAWVAEAPVLAGAEDAGAALDSAGPDSAAPDGQAPEIERVCRMEEADAASCVFATDAASLARAIASQAGLILVNESLRGAAGSVDTRLMWVRDARYAFALVAERLRPLERIGHIDASAVIAGDAVIGARTCVGAGAVIAAGVEIGEDCVIGPRVCVLGGTRLGDRVFVQAGAVLGSDGFGYVREPKAGTYLRFPQQGRLWIDEDVEIGANSTIDRGALGETRVGRGTKIDNLVHIGHNCCIGRDVVIAAQTGIGGSSTIEDGAVLGGQVGIADHVIVGEGVILGAQAGVPTGKRLRGPGQVFWGTPARLIGEYLRDLARLRRRN